MNASEKRHFLKGYYNGEVQKKPDFSQVTDDELNFILKCSDKSYDDRLDLSLLTAEELAYLESICNKIQWTFEGC